MGQEEEVLVGSRGFWLGSGWVWWVLVGSRGFWWVLLVWFVVATWKFWQVLANSGGLCVLVRSGGLASSG